MGAGWKSEAGGESDSGVLRSDRWKLLDRAVESYLRAIGSDAGIMARSAVPDTHAGVSRRAIAHALRRVSMVCCWNVLLHYFAQGVLHARRKIVETEFHALP